MAKKVRRGPKLKPDHEKQTKSILLKMTEGERETLKQAAEGLKLSTWARKVLLDAAKRKIRRDTVD